MVRYVLQLTSNNSNNLISETVHSVNLYSRGGVCYFVGLENINLCDPQQSTILLLFFNNKKKFFGTSYEATTIP